MAWFEHKYFEKDLPVRRGNTGAFTKLRDVMDISKEHKLFPFTAAVPIPRATAHTAVGVSISKEIEGLDEESTSSNHGREMPSTVQDLGRTLASAKQAVMGEMCDPILGHPEVVRAVSYHSGVNNTTNTNADGMDNTTTRFEGKAHYVVDKWCGFHYLTINGAMIPQWQASVEEAGNRNCAQRIIATLGCTTRFCKADEGCG